MLRTRRIGLTGYGTPTVASHAVAVSTPVLSLQASVSEPLSRCRLCSSGYRRTVRKPDTLPHAGRFIESGLSGAGGWDASRQDVAVRQSDGEIRARYSTWESF